MQNLRTCVKNRKKTIVFTTTTTILLASKNDIVESNRFLLIWIVYSLKTQLKLEL